MNDRIDVNREFLVHDSQLRTVPCRYGLMSYFALDGPIGDSLGRYGEWAQAEIDFLARLLPKGGTAIDAGANIGTHSLAFASLVGQEGTVYAIEAQPQVFEVLNRNIAQNGFTNISSFNVALSSTRGLASIPALDLEKRQNIGAFSLAGIPDEANTATSFLEVRTETLDALCDKHIDLLKADVEAMELEVLLGAHALIERSRPTLFLECNDLERGWQLVEHLRNQDYSGFFCRFPAFNPVNIRENGDNIFGVAHESSLLFVPNENAEALTPLLAATQRIDRLETLAAALAATPRYGDSTAYDRDPETLRKLLSESEEKRRVANESRLESDAHVSAVRSVEKLVGEVIDRAADFVGPPRKQSVLGECRAVYDILIPIYNAPDYVKTCIESVLRHTDPRHPVVLLDDASTDPLILPMLREFERADRRISVISAETNLGFVGNINRGFASSQHDVVILNADTVVTPKWLERLDRCRWSDSDIGVVSPLSNNATILSVPVMGKDNALPPGMSVDELSELVAASSRRRYPRLPTAVGFCMLITRDALNQVGVFDPAFGLGYGEESDFCMRSWQRGFEVVCCDDAYVHHYGTASFKSVKQIGKRRLNNAKLLARRWPQYDRAVQLFFYHNPLREVQEAVQSALDHAPGERRPHVLQVIHSFDAPGGTELHTRAMIDGLSERYRFTVMLPMQPDKKEHDYADFHVQRRDGHLRVAKLRRGNIIPHESVIGIGADLTNPVVEANFSRFLAGGDYDIVHFQHLAHWDTLMLPIIAKAFGKKVAISLHDYYLLCPEYNLIVPEYKRCGRSHASGIDSQCLRCIGAKRDVFADVPTPIDKYLVERKALVERVLESADVLISPSAFVRDRFCEVFGSELKSKIRVLPHGVSVSRRSPRPERTSTLRVGFLGNLTDRKGAFTVLEAVERLRGESVQVEVFGGVQDIVKLQATKLGVKQHGNYTHERLPELLAHIDLVIIPSVWDETFCMTVSEAVAMGIPVVASAVGAIPERVVDGVTGFLVPPGDPEALAERLRELVRHPELLDRVQQVLSNATQKTMDDNSRDYDLAYEQLLQGHDWSRQLVTELLGVTDRKQVAGNRNERMVEGYRKWCERYAPSDGEIVRLARSVEARGACPLIHLIMTISGGQMAELPDTLDALSAQRYEHWRLSIVADTPVQNPLFDQHPALQWVEVKENDWLETINAVACGIEADWVGVVEAGDRFDAALLLYCADHIQRHPGWQLLYTDEDRIDREGRRGEPRLKPDPNLEWLRGQAYTGRLCLIARRALPGLGGYRCLGRLDGYDLALRVIERDGQDAIGHIPRILYHARETPALSHEQEELLGCEIARQHLRRSEIEAGVEAGAAPRTWRVQYSPGECPDVAVILDANGSADEAENTIQSILEHSSYPRLQVCVHVDGGNNGIVSRLEGRFADEQRVRVLRLPCDWAACEAAYLLFVRAGTLVVQPNWVERLVSYALQPGVGVVGGRTVDVDGNIAGIGKILGLGAQGIAAPLQPGLHHSAPGYFGRAQIAQDVSVVGKECLLIDARLYNRVGIDLLAKGDSSAELDLCLEVAKQRRRIVWTPHATVLASGVNSTTELPGAQAATLRARWLAKLGNDPAFHPALSLQRQDIALEDELPLWSQHDSHDVPRILGIGFGSEGSWNYRGRHPLESLASHMVAQTATVPFRRDTIRVPNPTELAKLGVDTLLLHNAVHDSHIEALREYRRFNKVFLIFGQDDLMTELPAKNPFRASIYKDMKKRLRTCLSLCDRLVVTTDALKEHFRNYIADIHVIPNRLDARWTRLETRRRVGDRPRVGWVGALQHAGDLDILGDVVRETADVVDWVFMGMCPESIRPHIAEFHGPVPYEQYPMALAKLNLDIAVAPLEHNRFNEAKSNLRVLEYGAICCPVICTDIEPYRSAPVTRVANTTSAWVNAVLDYAHELDAAEQEGVELGDWVKRGWMLDDHVDYWTRALASDVETSPK